MSILFHLAVSGGVELLKESSQEALASSEAWDDLWKGVFEQPSGVWTAVNYIASIVVAVSFVGFSTYLLEQVVNRNAMPVLRHYLWLIVAMMLLANDGQLLAKVTTDLRMITAAQTQIIFQIQLGETSFNEAIQDVLITNDLKDWLGAQYRACEIKTGEAQIKCLEEVGRDASDLIDEAESQYGPLAGLRRIWSRVSNSFNITDPLGSKDRIVGLVLGSATQSGVRWFLKGCQWAFSHLFQLAMVVTGLYGPIAVAASTLPLPTRPLWAWFLGYLSVSMALWSYVLIIGLIAQVIVGSQMQESSDIGFLILLGIAAPFLAMALAAAGGKAVFQAMGHGLSIVTSIGMKFLPF